MCPIFKSSQAMHLLTDTPSISNYVGHCLNSLFLYNSFYLSSFYLLISTLFNNAFNVNDLFLRFYFQKSLWLSAVTSDIRRG